jgi:outer membrane protein TolC
MPPRNLPRLPSLVPPRGLWLRPLLFTALALGCLARAPGARAEEAAGWWSAFHDATLNLLLAETAPPAAAVQPQQALLALQLQADATAAYVLARVASVRLANGQLLADALQRQLELLRADGQDGSEAVRDAQQALDAARARLPQFEALRGASIALLAQRSGGTRSVAMLSRQLAPALGDARLPAPSFDVPRELPGIVLRRRPDVAQAEAQLSQAGRDSAEGQLRLARYLQALSAPIAPSAGEPADAAAGAQPEDVLEAARRDIASRLGRLDAAVAAAKQQEATLLALQPQYLALRERFQQGEVPEMQALGAMARMLVEEDRLAASAGQLAIAWIAFQASIGGAGNASASELLGARRSAE